MTPLNTLARILDIGVVPIARIAGADKAASVAEALIAGGIPVLELPLAFPESLSIIETVASRFGDKLLLGAGTVLSAQSARDAKAAGARYIVAPNFDTAVVDACVKSSVPVFPGCLTPTEIAAAVRAGADAIKVFPCNAMGGPEYIRSLLFPFPRARLFPCGGVSASNAQAYFAAGAAALFVGSSLIGHRLVEEGLFDHITRKAAELRAAAVSARRKVS